MSKFKPRTKRPEKGNKYYIRQISGGYNGAVQGYPKDKWCDVLSNCFAGETTYVTDKGIKTFAETVNTTQNVLNETGKFVPAEIKSFGVQQLYKVEIGTNTYFATGNHRWVVEKHSNYKGKKYVKRVIKTTLELKKEDLIPYNYYIPNTKELDANGILHGLVYGDGNKHINCSTYALPLFGDKKELAKYVPEHIRSEFNLKQVPDIDLPDEYLRGFIAGVIATDGTITKDSFKISSIKYDDLVKMRDICYKVGIRVGSLTSETRNIVLGKYKYDNHIIYYLTLRRNGIEDILIKNVDLNKLTLKTKNISCSRVKSVTPTDRKEEVFCAVEPQTHTITLEGGILTGQCVGYANGRFNEVLGDNKCKYQLVCNAENFVEKAKQYGLKTSSKPQVGAIMCWQKGKTLGYSDGAGHVAVVEKVYSDTEVMTSESGYACSTPFWNQRRKKGSGNWGMSSPYKFRCFILNPAVTETKNESKSTTTKTTTKSKISVDGIWGKSTTNALQDLFNITKTGTIKNQSNSCKSCLLSIDKSAWSFTTFSANGDNTIKKLQKLINVSADGLIGKNTITALQKLLKKNGLYDGNIDGKMGKETVKGLQLWINKKTK